MRSTKTSTRGFTLIELLLYVGILSLFLVVLTDMFGGAIDVQLESQSSGAVEQDGRYILQRVAYDVGQAREMTVPAAIGEQTATLQMRVNGQSTTYDLTGTDLRITDALGSSLANSALTQISNLAFLRLGNVGGKAAIQVRFTVTSKTVRAAGPTARNFQTTIGLR